MFPPMDLQERIRQAVEKAIPIYYVATPDHPADCRAKILYKEQLRALRIVKAWGEIRELITRLQGSETGVITAQVNNYFENYHANHDHKQTDLH